MADDTRKDTSFRDSLISDPDLITALAQASLYLSQGLYEKAEPLFRSIPTDFSKYHVAVSGLFNVLWLKDTPESRKEAMLLIDTYLDTADRSNHEVQPVVENFIKIKIDLLSKDEWLGKI